jgi:predicted AAA+ superfamily ATPase
VTAKAWMGILETSHLVFLLPPYFRNFNKRIIKSPKLYFFDTGLASWLLGITSADDLVAHFARGPLFENLIISEITKQQFQRGSTSELYFWQESNRREIDLLAERSGKLIIAEIKSGTTINASFFDNLLYFNKYAEEAVAQSYLIYGGKENQKRSAAEVRGWNEVEGIF